MGKLKFEIKSTTEWNTLKEINHYSDGTMDLVFYDGSIVCGIFKSFADSKQGKKEIP